MFYTKIFQLCQGYHILLNYIPIQSYTSKYFFQTKTKKMRNQNEMTFSSDEDKEAITTSYKSSLMAVSSLSHLMFFYITLYFEHSQSNPIFSPNTVAE